MRLKRFVRKIDVSAHVANHQDKNECFVARKCAVYLHRSLRHYPLVNEDRWSDHAKY
jgi:hypothetical protein